MVSRPRSPCGGGGGVSWLTSVVEAAGIVGWLVEELAVCSSRFSSFAFAHGGKTLVKSAGGDFLLVDVVWSSVVLLSSEWTSATSSTS